MGELHICVNRYEAKWSGGWMSRWLGWLYMDEKIHGCVGEKMDEYLGQCHQMSIQVDS